MKSRIDWSSPLVKGTIHMGVHVVALVVIALNWLLDINSLLVLALVCVVNIASIARSVLILRPYLAKRWPVISGSQRDDSAAPPLQ